LCLLALPALADALRPDTIRIATYNADLSRAGPGLMLQALRGDDPQAAAVVTVIAALKADVLLLTGIDYDLRGDTLAALADRVAAAGLSYPYRLALRPNTGVATGLDLDGNGRKGEPRDAMAYGRFAGEGGMAVLSRLPLDLTALRDFTGFLWADLPGNLRPPDTPAGQLLSTSGQYEVPVRLPDGRSLHLLTYYATPPVFDGPEDRNGRRNHDETGFWLRLLAGDLTIPPPARPFVLLGQPNLDPMDGEGLRDAIRDLLALAALQDPAPHGSNPRADPGQSGDPALDTALYANLGGLRVEQILPSADLTVAASGVLWPPDADPLAAVLAAASRHRPLWVDLQL
jgi:hypothetical protein